MCDCQILGIISKRRKTKEAGKRLYYSKKKIYGKETIEVRRRVKV